MDHSKTESSWFPLTASLEYYFLITTLSVSVLLGGSSRIDAWGLPTIYAVAGISSAFAILRMTKLQVARNWVMWGMTLCLVILFISHMVPLPARIWEAMPGRGLLTSIDQYAGLGHISRPLSLVPTRTLASTYALLPPVAILLLGGQITPRERRSLALILIGLVGLSSLVGVLQISEGPGSSFYFYDQSGNAEPVGLFANRNHQALFLSMLLPVMAAYIVPRLKRRNEHRNAHMIWSSLLAITIVALVIMTGSRAGTITMLIGASSIPLIVREYNQKHRGGLAAKVWLGATLASAALLLGFQLLIDNSPSLQRWIETTASDELRAKALPAEVSLLKQYFPVGSGFGSFPSVYEVVEPDDLLMQASFNHAHNDWMEFLIEGGLPSLIWLGLGIMIFVQMTRPLLTVPDKPSLNRVYGCAGGAIVIQTMLASVSDYPLRTPAVASALSVAILWTFAIRQKDDGESVHSHRHNLS